MIRILLADDHRIFRESMKHLLDDYGDLAVVAEAASGAEVIAHLGEQALSSVRHPEQ